MPFAKTIPRRLGLITLLLAAAALPAGRAATLETRTCSLTMTNGVVVGLSNSLCGEVLVLGAGPETGWSALHRLNQCDLRVEQAKRLSMSNAPTRIELTAEWEQASTGAADRMRTWVESEPGTGDILVRQEGQLTTNGLVGVSWGIASVPDSVEVLVPGCSGQRFGADAPAQRRVFDYPMMWEAPFVVIQGQRGGVIIWADDSTHRFKNLVLDHSQRSFRMRFESRNTAPFEDKTQIDSSRWRIRAYKGNWQAGAAIYRKWAKARFGLVPLEQKGPAWAREIRFVVIMSLDQPTLKALATHCNPTQTLLYLPTWRKDGYDRNYPDYTATAELAPFMAEAHRLGFRVMLHVNYFGCDPKNPLYESLKQYQVRDALTGELQWWEWPAEPPIRFAYLNPASRAWRETFVKRMVEVVAQYGADAFHLDQTLCIYNDKNGLIDGLNFFEGSLALHRQLRGAAGSGVERGRLKRDHLPIRALRPTPYMGYGPCTPHLGRRAGGHVARD